MKEAESTPNYKAENERRKKAADKANTFNKELLKDGIEKDIPKQNKQTRIEKAEGNKEQINRSRANRQ